MPQKTLLVGLAHPDDELAAAGAILAEKAHGNRIVVVWLTRGEMTEAFGPIPPDEVARRRDEHGRRAGEILGVETRFMDFQDTQLVATPEAAARVAKVIAEVRPDALLTWGEGWIRGMRHPDHQACGKIFRDAVTLARMAKTVAPTPPHRAAVPVFTYRDYHSPLPALAIDVEPYLEGIHALAAFYREEIGFGDRAWLEHRLAKQGAPWGVPYAELYDAWETTAGLVPSLLSTEPLDAFIHPTRPG